MMSRAKSRMGFGILKGILLPSALVLGLLVPDASADVPTKAAVDKMVKDNSDAQKAVKNSVPKAKRKRQREEILDKKEQEVADAEENLDKVNKDAKSTDKRKKEAKDKADSAKVQRDLAKQVADNTSPKNDTTYRDALKARRDARKALEDAQKALETAGGKDARKMRKAIRKALEETAPKTSSSSGGFLSSAPLGGLLNSGVVAMGLAGTGQTIGEVADLSLTNQGPHPVKVAVPPMVLVSRSGKSQHYAAPNGQVVSIEPGATVVVPIEGMCISRSKPPVGGGVAGELYGMNRAGQPLFPWGGPQIADGGAPGGTATSTTPPPGEVVPGRPGTVSDTPGGTATPSTPGSTPGGSPASGTPGSTPGSDGGGGSPAFGPDQVATILEVAKGIQEAAKKMQEDGAFEKIPYKDPEQQVETVEQWLTWSNPEISEITGETPATKEDLSTTVTKQIPKDVELTPVQQEQIDVGIDTIWGAIELTGTAAKDIQDESELFERVDPTAKEGVVF
jgi:hypothetical protein